MTVSLPISNRQTLRPGYMVRIGRISNSSIVARSTPRSAREQIRRMHCVFGVTRAVHANIRDKKWCKCATLGIIG